MWLVATLLHSTDGFWGAATDSPRLQARDYEFEASYLQDTELLSLMTKFSKILRPMIISNWFLPTPKSTPGALPQLGGVQVS